MTAITPGGMAPSPLRILWLSARVCGILGDDIRVATSSFLVAPCTKALGWFVQRFAQPVHLAVVPALVTMLLSVFLVCLATRLPERNQVAIDGWFVSLGDAKSAEVCRPNGDAGSAVHGSVKRGETRRGMSMPPSVLAKEKN